MCDDDQLNAFTENEEYVTYSVTYVTHAKMSSLKKDKKTGNVTVWTTFTTKDTNTEAINLGLGYMKTLKEFSPKTGKSRSLATVYYSCDGAKLHSNGPTEWSYVIPNSVDEGILDYVSK